MTFRYLILLIFISLIIAKSVLAGPTSSNYELKNYGFGAGGSSNSASLNYMMNAIVGEQSATISSTNYNVGGGLIYTQQANLTQAPTFSNPSSTYDRLKFIINNGSNPTDATFAIAITDDSWATVQYIQSDFTPGSSLGTEDWLTYTGWGGASGKYVTGLTQDTTYKIHVKARHGNFTETEWSADATADTSVPSLTFGISSDTVTFDPLTSGNSWTDSSKSTVLTTSTNAYNGYTVYGHETAALTNVYSQTIADYASPNSAPTTWTGTGFGYTTSDSSLAGGSADRFTSSGPNYAGFTTSAPGDPVADHSDKVDESTISNEQFTISYRVTASENHSAGAYTNTLLYVVVPVY
ncbi:hypothetical protein ACFL1A_01690 [Patescibacteria group bacterium]